MQSKAAINWRYSAANKRKERKGKMVQMKQIYKETVRGGRKRRRPGGWERGRGEIISV